MLLPPLGLYIQRVSMVFSQICSLVCAAAMFQDLVQYFQTILSEMSTMNYMRITLTVLAFSIFFWKICAKINELRMLPPGPWGVPFLGSLPWMRQGAPHSWYLQLAAKHGDLTSVKLGSNLMVCIGSPRLLRELFNRPDSIDRPHTPLYDILCGRGIILSEGLLWKKQRQFLHEKFRALGVKLWNYQKFQTYVMAEIEELLIKFENSMGEPVQPGMLLGRHVHNIICQLMMSFRFGEHDSEFQTFNERVTKGMELYGAIHIGEHIPAYLYLPGKMAVLKEIGRNLRDISEFHVKQVAKRRKKLMNTNLETHEPTDLLDYYLIELEKYIASDSKLFHGVDPDEQVVQVFNDLFSAGMETSRTALLWSLLMMLREPTVAARVRSELAQVLEPGELVTLDHRPKLAYIEAVIYETLRTVSVVPLGTTHVNSNEWKVGDYVIPAGTHLVPLLNKINMDPDSFPEPDKFHPERFLQDGILRVPENFIPFGIGRRVCLGEQLARIELFLFFANIMNSFEFFSPEGEVLPGLEGVIGITHAPLPYKLCFKKLGSGHRSVQQG